MGVVYEALDRQRNTRVALKTLRDTDAHLLYRLKREFRSLRDLIHRNLVALEELFEEGGHWFFTMELVDGEDLHAYLHRVTWDPSLDHVPTELGVATPPPSASARTRPGAVNAEVHARRPPQALDFDRVREVFGQIAEGLLAIHEAGKIHRDIKPSNIIVARDGRAVVLDFGLVTEQHDAMRSGEGEIVGTLLYMAPEQAAARAVGPPADWYSVGVMLYEVITGQRPFEGPWGGLLAAMQPAGPRDPKELAPSCPGDLAELCLGLLALDPAQRPQGPEILSRLVAGKRPEATAARAPSASQRRIFVGRRDELRELRRAFDEVNRGTAISVFIDGESGIGKSTLIHHFASAVGGEAEGAVVLAGQCRELEAIPFKAMDGVIDALSRHLCRLSDVAAAELVPQNAALLSGVFPVLGRVPAIAKAPRPIHTAGDPFQQRNRVFTALRQMFCLLTERSRLILIIDDMQWVDSDSLHLLGELLRPPDPPRLLLLASVRSGEEAPAPPPLPGYVRRVHLRPLDPEASAALAELLLERMAPEQKDQTARIVEETGGHPLFIGELVCHAATPRHAALKQLRLDEAIWARVSELDPVSLRVLELLTLAVAPLAEEILQAAAELEAGRFQRSVAVLRASYLVRSASPSHAVLEIYHDRVRQAVAHHLAESERIGLNERLAEALEAAGAPVPPELLIHHLQRAGQLERAARKALEAADRARAGLAFEQASQLYKVALELAAWPEAERREILTKLGDTLASAGRGPEAADVYARAADGADPITRRACRIQEVDLLLQSGYLERAAVLLFSLFQESGHAVPGSQTQVSLRVLWDRMRLARRGLRWTERPRSEIPPQDLMLLALYKAAGRGLGMIDPIRAAYFVMRGLHLSMDLGDRDSVTYFLYIETAMRVGEGAEKHEALLRDAEALLQRHPDLLYQVFYQQHLGLLAYLSTDRSFKDAFELLDRCDEELAQAPHVSYELTAGRYFLVSSLLKLGDLAKLRAYSERFIWEAEQRGNLYARTTFRRRCNILWLVDDDPAGALEALGTDSWISYAHGYHVQHWLELQARVEIAIYEGAPIDPAFLSQHLKSFERSSLKRMLDFRCDTAWMVSRMALAGVSGVRSPSRTVRRSIARLRSYRKHYPKLLAHMLGASLAAQEGDLDRAAEELREVVALGEAAHSSLITAAARRRLGAVIGGEDGRALVAAAERWMREAGIKNPDRMTHLLLPWRAPARG